MADLDFCDKVSKTCEIVKKNTHVRYEVCEGCKAKIKENEEKLEKEMKRKGWRM